MHADKTTLNDLSIFSHEEEHSLFHFINFTTTTGGREWLFHFLNSPLDSIDTITQTQRTIEKIGTVIPNWPVTFITNGTIMVVEKFYDTPITELPRHAYPLNSFLYRVFNTADFSLVRYSVRYFMDFITGLQQITQLLEGEDTPLMLTSFAERIEVLLNRPGISFIRNHGKLKTLTISETLRLGYYIRTHFKSETFELIEIYGKLDAYLSMATACKKYQFCFPEMVNSENPQLEAAGLYHPMLQSPVSYNESMTQEQNFLFLTGANMAGKSTFIKAVGIAVYLAHIGMGVPAKKMKLCLFDGILSNINVVDNIIQGESYFYNEVQRIHRTIEKISDGKKWLILIDELFKGTNVQDAMKCSTVVIEGLRKMHNGLFILSTHLYEIGEGLKKYSNIQFRYFETEIKNGELLFNYQLKEGISNDRLGYLILKREGVVDLLEKL